MRFILTFFAVTVFVAALGFAGVMGLYFYFARALPDPSSLSHRQLFQTARMFDRSGKLLLEVNDPQGGRRILVHLTDIPLAMRQATIAAEDASFYDNPGFDVRAVVRATYQWVRIGSPQSGASTITQQLVKTRFSDLSKPPNARSKRPSWPWSSRDGTPRTRSWKCT